MSASSRSGTEVGTLTGAELVRSRGRHEPLLPYLADAGKFGTQDAFLVILSDHDVNTEDGTGVVHMARPPTARPTRWPATPW